MGKSIPTGLDIFLITFFLYFFIAPYAIQVTIPSGDEPYLLLITHSLLYDHDINLANNLQNKDYRNFSPSLTHDLPLQPHDIVRAGYYRSHHFPVFPALLIPGYAIAGRLGVIWEINLLTALAMVVFFNLCLKIGLPLHGTLLGTISLACTSPMVIYSSMIYREILASLLILLLVQITFQYYLGKNKKNWLFPLLILVLAFLGLRYLIPIVPLILTIIYLLWHKQIKERIWFLGIGLISMILVIGIYYSFFQKEFFENLFAGQFLSWTTLPNRFIGLFFDQQWGLFFVAPIFILIILGIFDLTRYSEKQTLLLASMCFLYMLIMSCFLYVFGWACPAPRYLLCILPVFAIFLSAFFSCMTSTWGTYISLLLAFFSGLITIFHILLPQTRESLYHSMKNQLFTELGNRLHADFGRFFPSFLRINEATFIFPITMFILFIILAFIHFHTKPSISKKPSSLVFQPLYFSSLSIGIFCLLMNMGIYKPVHVIEMEDTETIRTNVGWHYPLFTNILEKFQNNEEDFGLGINQNGWIQANARLPQGLSEFTLLTKVKPISDISPFLKVGFKQMDFGQNEIEGNSYWTKNVYIGELHKNPEIFTLSYLNHALDTETRKNRMFYTNKILINPSHLNYKLKYIGKSGYEITFSGYVPREIRALSINIPNTLPGDYILHMEIQPGFEDKLHLKLGLKVNSQFLSRVYNEQIALNKDVYYWVHSDSSGQDIQMVLSKHVFDDIEESLIEFPIKRIIVEPFTSSNQIPNYEDTHNRQLFQFSKQVLSLGDTNPFQLSFHKQKEPLIGLLWAMLESDKEISSVPLEIKNQKGELLGQCYVNSTSWAEYPFEIQHSGNADTMTISMSTTSPRDRLDEGPYVYLHKLSLVHDTPTNRLKFNITE